MYIQYDKTVNSDGVHEVFQVTEDVVPYFGAGYAIAYAAKDYSVAIVESIPEPEGLEEDTEEVIGNTEVLGYQYLPDDLTVANRLATDNLKHIFDLASREYDSGGNTFPNDLDSRTYVIGLVSSAQQAISDGDTTWSTTRFDVMGVPHQLDSVGMINHAKDLETSTISKFTKYQTDLASTKGLGSAAEVYALMSTNVIKK